MEIDFMGLTLKQETSHDIIDAAQVRSLAMEWSFSNKNSSHPQILSFQNVQEKKHLKTGFESLTSAGLVTLTTTEDYKSYPAPHKNIVPEKQGVHWPMNNQTNLAVMSSKSHVVGGTTDLRKSTKIPGDPTRLTIFYNGSVCVCDNISAEKAHAIMLLAGNVQTSIPRSSFLDDIIVSSSPVPQTSMGVKPVFISSSNIDEPLKVKNLLGPVSGNLLSSGTNTICTVPQFRKKSLARFLEKRKERAISALPYGGDDKKQSPDCSKPGAINTSLSVNSSGSYPLPPIN